MKDDCCLDSISVTPAAEFLPGANCNPYLKTLFVRINGVLRLEFSWKYLLSSPIPIITFKVKILMSLLYQKIIE